VQIREAAPRSCIFRDEIACVDASLLPQRHRRIDGSCASRWNVTGDERHETEHYGSSRVRKRISGFDAEQLTAEEPRGGEARRHANGGSDQGEPAPHGQRQTEHVAPGCAKRHAHAQFVRATRHVERQDAVDAGGRERKTQRRERSERR
jgi:hypothetical protein